MLVIITHYFSFIKRGPPGRVLVDAAAMLQLVHRAALGRRGRILVGDFSLFPQHKRSGQRAQVALLGIGVLVGDVDTAMLCLATKARQTDREIIF